MDPAQLLKILDQITAFAEKLGIDFPFFLATLTGSGFVKNLVPLVMKIAELFK